MQKWTGYNANWGEEDGNVSGGEREETDAETEGWTEWMTKMIEGGGRTFISGTDVIGVLRTDATLRVDSRAVPSVLDREVVTLRVIAASNSRQCTRYRATVSRWRGIHRCRTVWPMHIPSGTTI